MKHVLLIIGSLLLLSAGRGVWEEEEKVVLREEQQKLAVEVLSLYLEVDSSRMAELVTSSQVVDSLVGRGENGEKFDPAFIYRTVAHVDSMARTGIELAMQNKPWALLELLEKERENFYVHPNNVIENELGFHQLLVVLYQMCYGNTKTAFTKIVPLMEITRLHIYAWEVMKGEEHPYYIDVLADLLRCCIWAEEYEKAIEVGKEWCGRMEEDDENYVAGMVVLGKLYGQVGMINKQKRCFRLMKNSPLFEKLNAMSLSELCE
ncbi:MAG: hypothetical protein BHV68_02245 [Bacteroidales bacterium 43_8]|nr:MAG: hypothetical protein BHV68_02245 [Bacteroidales bacterium 43_8]